MQTGTASESESPGAAHYFLRPPSDFERGPSDRVVTTRTPTHLTNTSVSEPRITRRRPELLGDHRVARVARVEVAVRAHQG